MNKNKSAPAGASRHKMHMESSSPSVAIFAAEADAQRVGKMLRAGGGAYSTALPEIFYDFSSVLAVPPDVCLAVIPHVTDAVQAWLEKIGPSSTATVVLTDNPDVAAAVRNVGIVASGH